LQAHINCRRNGEVVSIDDEGGKNSQVLVKLVKSGEKVVYDDELVDVGSWEEEPATKKIDREVVYTKLEIQKKFEQV